MKTQNGHRPSMYARIFFIRRRQQFKKLHIRSSSRIHHWHSMQRLPTFGRILCPIVSSVGVVAQIDRSLFAICQLGLIMTAATLFTFWTIIPLDKYHLASEMKDKCQDMTQIIIIWVFMERSRGHHRIALQCLCNRKNDVDVVVLILITPRMIRISLAQLSVCLRISFAEKK